VQAIVTKFICPTNARGSRYKATCQAGSITVSARCELSSDANHAAACAALCQKLDDRCRKEYGIPDAQKSWSGCWSLPTVAGQLPDGTYAHVFLPIVREVVS
jgi:hypothetical protein